MESLGNYLTIKNIIIVILGIIGLVWLIYGLWRNSKINRISLWPTTNAIVLNSVAEPANQNVGSIFLDPRNMIMTTDNSAQYIPRVIYKYKIGPREYQSDSVVYSGASSYNTFDIKTMLGQLYPGATIPVYYNPNNFNESYIYNGKFSYYGPIVGIILLLIAGYFGYYHNYASKKITVWKDTPSPNLTEVDITRGRNKNSFLVKKTSGTNNLF